MSYDNSVLRVVLMGVVLAVADGAAQSVEGHVVNAVTGVDIAGGSVNLVRRGLVAYSATSDSQGRFRIEKVEAGTYTAQYTARGYFPVPNFLVDEDFERECGVCFLKERGGRPFEVNGGIDPVRLEMKLPPLARVSGRVLDSTGEPVSGAAVQLHWGENWLCSMPSCSGISRQAKTNEKGEYSVGDLDVPGAWLVSAIAPGSWRLPETSEGQRLEWAQTFYAGVTDPLVAVRVMVRFGSDIPNVDIKLAAVAVHHVRGVVLDENGNRVAGAAATLGRNSGLPSLTQKTAGNGTFEFEAVPEGEWRISAKIEQNGIPHWTSEEVRVGGRDLENLQLRPAAPFAIQGMIVMEAPEGAVVPRAPAITLAFHAGASGFAGNPAGNFVDATADANGEFQIQKVYPGRYQILTGPAPPRYYLDSIRVGGHDALGRDVEIVPGTQALTVAYKPGGGTVHGTVEKCAAGTVRLLPRDKTMRRPGFILFAGCDANDHYEISAVRPGEYYVLAIAGDSSSPWYATGLDEEGLVRNAGTVTVRAGENSLADLRAIGQ